MRYTLFLVGVLLLFGCQQPTQNNNETLNSEELAKELKSIEVTRAGFIKAIDEKQYQDLANWTTKDLIQVLPNDAAWNSMFQSRGILGLFPYDSIRMQPIETVILNDSMAYDFGVSTVYFADSLGQTNHVKDTYLALLKKDSIGRWRLFREVASSNILEK